MIKPSRISTLLLVVLLFSTTHLLSEELKPFTSDGCSSFPNGTVQHQSLWINCCIQHDFSYWKGGTREQRLKADNELEICVSKIGKPEIAKIMLYGVRVGGSPYIPTPYRWGYGWNYLRGYKKLSDNDLKEVKRQLNKTITILQEFDKNLK